MGSPPTGGPKMDYIIEMRNIVKKFGQFVANDQINLSVKTGEIHALLGENGAGKSTLMNVLYGLYRKDEGEILYNGERAEINGPGDAIKLNIGMVHQHFMLIPTFTVVENLMLGAEPVKGLNIDVAKAIEDIKRVSEEYGLAVDPHARVSNISVGMQQRVELLKVLSRGAKVLIFDEPTAVLTPQEITEFFAICRRLQERGHTIIIITHKLKEIKQVSDRVTVIRHGKNIGTVDTDSVSEQDLAGMMVGRKVVLSAHKCEQQCGEVVLEMENVHARNFRGLPALKGVSFRVCAGEIVGIAGVEGNGQTEIALVLKKLLQTTDGTIRLGGNEYSKKTSTQNLIDWGLSHIPEDRQKHGLILNFTIKENLILGIEDRDDMKSGLFMNRNRIQDLGETLIDDYDIRCRGTDMLAGGLSGGNQQKVILAREISRNPKLLIASQPTRGLDVGAIEYVHQQLLEQRSQGCAILLISYELDEIMALSDRILAIYDGQIVSDHDACDVTRDTIGLAMAGVAERSDSYENVRDERYNIG